MVDRYETLSDYCQPLGDDAVLNVRKSYFAFRRLKNSACIEVHPGDRQLLVYAKVNPDDVDLGNPMLRDVRSIGHFGTGDLEIRFTDDTHLDVAKHVIGESLRGQLTAMRPLRLVTVAGRVTIGFRRAFGRKGFTPLLVAVGAVVMSCGVAVWLFERGEDGALITGLADALWWSIVSSTTVGYGDMVPVPPGWAWHRRAAHADRRRPALGRHGNIATFFIEESDSEHDAVIVRLDRIEALLTSAIDGPDPSNSNR